MKNEGSVGAYVSATGPIDLPRPKRRKHRPARQRHVCPDCTLPLVRPGAFHVCLDLSAPEPVVVVQPVKVKKAKKAPKPRAVLTPEERLERKRASARESDKRRRLAADWKCIEGCGATTARQGTRCAPCRYKYAPSTPSKIKSHLDDVRARYESGEKVVVIAAEYGVTSNHIRKILRQAGVEQRSRNKVFSPADVDRLVAAYQGGESMRAIAERFGIAQTTVARYLDAAGVQRRPLGRKAVA